MIQNQNDPYTLSVLTRLYDPRSLSEVDFHLVTSIREKIPQEKKKDWYPAEEVWVSIKLEEALVIQMLESGDLGKMRLALRYMEFHPKEKFLFPVVRALKRQLPGELIPRGVLVLSILSGRKFDLRTYLRQLEPGARNSFYRVDCSIMDRSVLLKLKEHKDEVVFNRCIREYAVKDGKKPALMSEVGSWLSLPLSGYWRQRLSKSMKRDIKL